MLNLTIALELSIDEVTFIEATIFPLEPTLSMLLALEESSSVDSFAVVPALFTLSVLQVIEPIANVSGSVGVNEGAIAISLVLSPVSLVNVTVSVGHAAHTTALSISPHAFVLGSIRPQLHT